MMMKSDPGRPARLAYRQAPMAPSGQSPRSDYQRGWRRMLVDMEIPGWDDRFLTEFDPIAKADLYARAGLTSVMFSCKALTGLCFWPTDVGEMHPGIGERDVVGETTEALRACGIAACAYCSVIYDNWAAETHPEWTFEPLQAPPVEPSPGDRHGLCCPNNPGYRGYITAQIADLFGRYEFGCAFCDMTFWPGVCGCGHCRDRLRLEAGIEIPKTIDWTDVDWCTFQSARERWIGEFAGLVTDEIRRSRPGIAVYHNFAPAPAGWTLGVPFAITEHNDFLGGDLYGDATEQLVITKLMNNLSRTRPVEYMTFCTVGTFEHVRLKSAERMRTQVVSAVAESAAFMFIDAVDPVGTANPKVYERVSDAFEGIEALEPYLGGEAVEDVAVYFSSDSKVDFGENGQPLVELRRSRHVYPHLLAVRGACRILQRAHIPFGVITRRQLPELDRYRVLVLPNVTRMDGEETDAVRDYVRAGGRVYASRYTSLVETRGVRHDDFMLADAFGVHLEREEPCGMVYAKPATAEVGGWIDPQQYLSANPNTGSLGGGLLRLRAEEGAKVLATLSLPYAHPDPGSFTDRRWASIHSFPPWEDTNEPVLVEHPFGEGRFVYSAFDIEGEEADVNDRLFASLVGSLLGDDWSFQCDTEPSVSVAAFRASASPTVRVSLRNSPPALVPSVTLRLRPPDGCQFVELEEVPSGRSVAFDAGVDATLHCTIPQLGELTMLIARYESARSTT